MVSRSFDVVIVGAGPAGMAAMLAASRGGSASVAVVDDNPSPGGQIWRGGATGARDPGLFPEWNERIRQAMFTFLPAMQILGPLAPGVLLAEAGGEGVELRYRSLIVATGARELFLPFPGWTLPNVMGVGGLQAMVKSGLPIEGKAVVAAGSGPLLLAVAASLRAKGADVRVVAEQAPMTRLVGFGLGLWREPGKLRQAIALKRAMGRIVFRVGWWPVAAEGENRVEAVVLTNGARRERIGCDYLACGFGLAPNVELALALGCDLTSGFVAVDSAQRTSKPDVFAAGEITGIGGVDLSIIEGEIAGFAAVGDEAAVRERFAKRERARRFARGLERTFAIRDELKHTADPTTIVCRCEDVPHAALVDKTSWVDAKLQTRCGMGPCQGRICGAATAVLYGWSRASVRPPIFPTALGSLAGAGASHDARSSSS